MIVTIEDGDIALLQSDSLTKMCLTIVFDVNDISETVRLLR